MPQDGPETKIDLGKVFARPLTAVTLDEHEDERVARLEAEKRAKRIEDGKGVAVFVVLLAAIVVASALSTYVAVFDPGASPESKRWAQTVLSSILTGSVTFVAGRKIGGK